MLKRRLEDSQISRDEYNHNEQHNTKSTSSFGAFPRADHSTLATRTILTTRTSEYHRHVMALNLHFTSILKSQMEHSSTSSWLKNMTEYKIHAARIEERYGSWKGHVWTFGSGDCGQLAHGVEKDKDLMVHFPRQVLNLKATHITRIACGGLHSVAVDAVGQIYTWGCNDDGALGRSGDENMPAKVEGFPTGILVNQAVAGDCHTAVLTVCGKVFTWGKLGF